MGYIIATIIMLLLNSSVAHAASEVRPPDVVTPKIALEKRRFWIRGGFATGFNPARHFAGEANLGYRFGLVGMDLGIGYGKTDFESIKAVPGYAFDLPYADGYPSATDPSSELNRVRNGTDPWTYLKVGPGVSILTKLFPEWAPRLNQKARFSVNYSSWNDSLNSLTFKGWLISTEGGVQYQLSPASPLALDLSFDMTWGWASSSSAASAQLGRIPIAYVRGIASLVIWL